MEAKKRQIERLDAILQIDEGFFNGLTESFEQFQQLQDKIFKLEAICLLHGVGSSIHMYMNMDSGTLGALVKQCYGEGWKQIPFEFMPGTPKPAQRANNPVLGIEGIKELAFRNPGWLIEATKGKKQPIPPP